MAARRLLIVMLVLLGISTLAAALVPQSTLNDDNPTTGSSTTTQATTTTATTPTTGKLFPIKLKLGGPPVVIDCSAAKRREGKCEPIHVGDQLSLTVFSTKPTQLSIDAYGLIGFASPTAPAFFDLIVDSDEPFGIAYQPSGKPAAQIRVGTAKRPTRAEPGPA